MPYANKGADQPARMHSLIDAFVVSCLDSIIPLVSITEISNIYLASVAAHHFESTLVANPKDRFSIDEAHIWNRTRESFRQRARDLAPLDSCKCVLGEPEIWPRWIVGHVLEEPEIWPHWTAAYVCWKSQRSGPAG